MITQQFRVIGDKELRFGPNGADTDSYSVVGIGAQRYILKIVFARNF